ncbi:hypothetical protein E0Z10_g2152 [Xylaria hypoxylon]|uniref:RSE1/DDB1/CPSF1 C-terminal domain-containing protein n=1 Tax=Xylaria hypoxylon TaxID=37992 RepID=A0A4Z0Z6U5_9PEZI|nr:hypothetical protein E0Z10_g2152 [Xylaria hypoxylon]
MGVLPFRGQLGAGIGKTLRIYDPGLKQLLRKARANRIVVGDAQQGSFIARENIDFFQILEMYMRSQDPSLAGRDHLMYRSYYAPVKGVIDGDLCERSMSLPSDKKQIIAGELYLTVREIERKNLHIRTRSAS